MIWETCDLEACFVTLIVPCDGNTDPKISIGEGEEVEREMVRCRRRGRRSARGNSGQGSHDIWDAEVGQVAHNQNWNGAKDIFEG